MAPAPTGRDSGNVPYGYQRNGKGLVVHPEEAETVRTIFELASRGETGSKIARALNDKGLGRRNGKPWTPRQAAAILVRRAFYAEGMLRYGEVHGQNDRVALLGERATRTT